MYTSRLDGFQSDSYSLQLGGRVNERCVLQVVIDGGFDIDNFLSKFIDCFQKNCL
jgi:hypothetical protein